MASTGFLLRKDDYPNGIATAADVQKLAALLNPYLTNVNTLISQGGNSFSDNFACEVQTGTFSHNVATGFSLKKLPSAKGCVVLGCDSAFVLSVIMKAVQVNVAGGLPQVSVTVLFTDPGVVGAKVTLLLLPEGQLFTAG